MLCTHQLQVKTGPFAEHSNALWGISSVAEWTKVNSGLIKMYKAEVRSSFVAPASMLFIPTLISHSISVCDNSSAVL